MNHSSQSMAKAGATMTEPRPSRFGPVFCDGNVHFQLWAPTAKSVAVLIDGHPPKPMTKDPDGFWRRDHRGGGEIRYWFDVDGLRVPDPASRFQPLGVSGPSEAAGKTGYVWKCTDWRGRPWEEVVCYELHVGVFGGYDKVAERLPELAALGITAIELMPIAEFAGERNWGYDGVLPFAPASAYGHPDSLRALIDRAHELGVMVFLDAVYNHFGPAGNWLPSYAPEFFDQDRHTPWGAGIDFKVPQVREFFSDNAHYWLSEFRFDGIRFDAVHAIPDRGWLVEMATSIRRRFSDRHIHLVVENEDNCVDLLEYAFTAQWNDDFHNVMHVLLTGEAHSYYRDFASNPAERLARCLSDGFIYQGEPSRHGNGRPRGQASAHLPPSSFVAFLQNHDQIGNRAFGERLRRLAHADAIRAAMVLLLLGPQIPLLFMGEEAGATEPFLFFTAFDGELGNAVRDGRRIEFANAPGFSHSEQRDAIPDPNDRATFAASIWSGHADDAADWRREITELLRLRREHIIPGLRGARAMQAKAVGPAAVTGSWRLGNGNTLTIAVNFGEQAVEAKMPESSPIHGLRPEHHRLNAYTAVAWVEQ